MMTLQPSVHDSTPSFPRIPALARGRRARRETPSYPLAATPSGKGLRELFGTRETLGMLKHEGESFDVLTSWKERVRFEVFRASWWAHRVSSGQPLLSEVLGLDEDDVLEEQRSRMVIHGLSQEVEGGHRLTRREISGFCNLGLTDAFDLSGVFGKGLASLRARCLSHQGEAPHVAFKDVKGLSACEEITARVSSILGEGPVLSGSEVVVQEGRSTSPSGRWALPKSGAESGTRGVSVWIALTRAHLEDGCLQVIPGSFSLYLKGILHKVIQGQIVLDDPVDAYLLKCVCDGDFPAEKARQAEAHLMNRLLSHNHFLRKSIELRDMRTLAVEMEAGQFFLLSEENHHAFLPKKREHTTAFLVLRYTRRGV